MLQKTRIKAFTLIELLVVIAIISLLLAIVTPSLKRAKEYAKKAMCKSNLHQISLAIGSYESQYLFNFRTNDKWYFNNGSGDLPYEGPESKYSRDLMQTGMLPDRKVFFCPGVRGVSYEKNYRYNAAVAGDITNYDVGTTENLMRSDPSFTDRPAFWSTYAWLWKKGDNPNSNAASVNNASNGALLVDVPNTFWQLAISLGNTDSTLLKNIFGDNTDRIQTVSHGNVLMKDLSVNNPADKDDEFTMWLWDSTRWAGM